MVDFTGIDTTIFNLNRAVVNNKERKYKRIISIEVRAFSDFCNSQFSHYSLSTFFTIPSFSHSALTLPKKSKYKHKHDFWLQSTKISLTRHFSKNLRKSLLNFDWHRLKSFSTIWIFNFDYLSNKDGKKIDAKNEDEKI